MRLIKPHFEIWEQKPGIQGIYKAIERAGRICYLSGNKITEDSAKPFVDRMIKNGHCYTGDTEVLTENGWIKFKDYSGEKVATINKDCSFKGFETPSRVVNYSYKGNFYYYPLLGIEVTDGHNMFGVFREMRNDFYNNSSYSLFSCNTLYKDNNGRGKTLGERMFKTPRHCTKPLTLNPYGELIGFWLGDGCYSPETKNKLIFHLKKKRKVEYLKQLCSELGYVFEKRKSNYYTVTDDNIGSSFNSLFYNKGKRISLQYFPSIDIAYSIINGLIHSDGSLGINTKTITFTNTSKSIIDWLLMYAPICGFSISDRGISHNTSSHNPVYKVLLLNTNYTINNDSRNKDSKVIITNKVEEVYCVTVSTGLIIVRGTNGITTICGNCSMLEHGTVYLKLTPSEIHIYHKYRDIPYTKVNVINSNDPYPVPTYYISTNYRVLVEHGWLDDLKYLCEPTEHHERRATVHFVLPIGISREFCRHRVMSFAEQSTRYCNFSSDKFNNELTFIEDTWCDEELLRQIEHWYINSYFKPQEKRNMLPLCTKTELVMTGFVSDWWGEYLVIDKSTGLVDQRIHGEFYTELNNIDRDKYRIVEKGFFPLRCSNGAHPQAQELAIPLREEFIKRELIK